MRDHCVLESTTFSALAGLCPEHSSGFSGQCPS